LKRTKAAAPSAIRFSHASVELIEGSRPRSFLNLTALTASSLASSGVNRDILHKIGVTGGDVARRLINAKLDPTFLMADVEIVATYELYNINRTKLENLIHRIFAAARLDIQVQDRFGQPIIPREWFLVPLFAIDEAVGRIKDGTITGYAYDPKAARLTQAAGTDR
jgi:Meiotically Up-regulated Gene 113 (MUG113) protein